MVICGKFGSDGVMLQLAIINPGTSCESPIETLRRQVSEGISWDDDRAAHQ